MYRLKSNSQVTVTEDDLSDHRAEELTNHPSFSTALERTSKLARGGVVLMGFYVTSLVLCGTVLLLELIKNRWFLVVEGLLNLTLFVEVSMGICAFKGKYFKHSLNIIDFSVLILSVTSFIIVAATSGSDIWNGYHRTLGDRYLGMFDTILLIVRYSMQCVRLVALVRKSMELRRHDHEDIVFPVSDVPTRESQ
jgi:hypothetical protein